MYVVGYFIRSIRRSIFLLEQVEKYGLYLGWCYGAALRPLYVGSMSPLAPPTDTTAFLMSNAAFHSKAVKQQALFDWSDHRFDALCRLQRNVGLRCFNHKSPGWRPLHVLLESWNRTMYVDTGITGGGCFEKAQQLADAYQHRLDHRDGNKNAFAGNCTFPVVYPH